MLECPVDGCDYTGSKEAVKGHWGGKQDGDHTGAWHEAFEAAQEGSAEGGADPTGEAQELESESSGSSEDGSAASSGDPTMGDVDPDRDGSDVESGSGSDVQELPCGHESFDESAAPEPPFVVSCDTCNQSWEVTSLD